MKYIKLTPELYFSDSSKVCPVSLFSISTKVRNLSKVQQGEEIINIFAKSTPDCEIPYVVVTSPCDGWIDFGEIKTNAFEGFQDRVVFGDTIACVYESYEEIEKFSPKNSYVVTSDPFTSEQFIKWNVYHGSYYGSQYYERGIRIGTRDILLGLYISKSDRILRLMYSDYSSCRKLRLKIKDTITFLFSDGSILPFTITHKSYQCEDILRRAVDIPITESELEILSQKGLLKMRITFGNGDTPLDCDNNFWNDVEIGVRFFKRYITDYVAAIKNSNISFAEHHEGIAGTEMTNLAIKREKCSVYLMVDIVNGYHKIGISNSPKYREHTLQSEKPTIELLCSKEYPSRMIAEAIESALHKAFDSKRLRGEWFNLSLRDIQEIKETLK